MAKDDGYKSKQAIDQTCDCLATNAMTKQMSMTQPGYLIHTVQS